MPISGSPRPPKPSSLPGAKEAVGKAVQACSKAAHLPQLIDDGAKALTGSDAYKGCPQAVKDEILSKAFTDEEKGQINEVLDKMGGLMACANHPVKHIGRTAKAISRDDSGCEAESRTYGEWFEDQGTLILTDVASNPLDFKDKATQFKGTLAHELTHGLTNGFDPRTCTAYDDMADNPLMQEWAKATGWDPTLSNLADPSKAPTDYAKTNAAEDLSETVMMYLYAPDELKKKSPERHAFAKKLLEGGP